MTAALDHQPSNVVLGNIAALREQYSGVYGCSGLRRDLKGWGHDSIILIEIKE